MTNTYNLYHSVRTWYQISLSEGAQPSELRNRLDFVTTLVEEELLTVQPAAPAVDEDAGQNNGTTVPASVMVTDGDVPVKLSEAAIGAVIHQTGCGCPTMSAGRHKVSVQQARSLETCAELTVVSDVELTPGQTRAVKALIKRLETDLQPVPDAA